MCMLTKAGKIQNIHAVGGGGGNWGCRTPDYVLDCHFVCIYRNIKKTSISEKLPVKI